MQWKQFKKLTEQLWGVTYSPDVTTESTTRGPRFYHRARLGKVYLIVTELSDGKIRDLHCFYEDLSVTIPLAKKTSKRIQSDLPLMYNFLTTMVM